MTRYAVIFDLDGLLANTEPIWSKSTQLLLSRRGKTFDPALKPRFMGRHPLEVAGLLAAHYGLQQNAADLLEERLVILRQLYAERPIAAMPGALALVKALGQAAVPLAVASGSPLFLVQTVLERLELSESFAVQLGSDQVERGKPHPDLFLLAADRLGVAPPTCVVLEDAPAGVDAARAAGMAVAAVPSKDVPRDQVAHADLVLGSLEAVTPATLCRLAQRKNA